MKIDTPYSRPFDNLSEVILISSPDRFWGASYLGVRLYKAKIHSLKIIDS